MGSNSTSDNLTPRELEVARLYMKYPMKKVARYLGISWHTVDVHISSVYRKLGAHSVRDLYLKLGDKK